jgi:hypothetical protein
VSQLIYGDAIYLRRIDQYVDYAANRSGDAVGAIIKAVVLTTEMRAYQHALALLGRAVEDRVISDADHSALAEYVSHRARAAMPLLRDLQRLAIKLAHRLRHPGRN